MLKGRKRVVLLGLASVLALGLAVAAVAGGDEEDENETVTGANLRPVEGTQAAAGPHWTLIGWNDLGMHCMDGTDFSVFAVLPPFNTIHAHLIDPTGKLVSSPAGIAVTYQAVSDPAGSINRSSKRKTNFWQYAPQLFGLPSLAPDVGLSGYAMPGAANTAQAMQFDASHNWFTGEGIPITPFDDAGLKNPYPMMRLVARDSAGTVLASTKIVLPVSDEMDCKVCHASGSVTAARPAAGWVYHADPRKDVKLNILLLHDEKRDASYPSILQSVGYNPAGLYATSTSGTSVLCYQCHTSNALPGPGLPALPPLTQAVHRLHAGVIDPTNGLPMDQDENRTSCYRCHPGSATKCLRGAMGKAVAADGTMAMQCQSCHGNMSALASTTREGWLNEPACQSCHTGTAADNNGQIRYTSVFETSGQERQAVNVTFATNSDTPNPGLNMYRFSTGHGGLQCSACHGSTHAEYPTSHVNDNIQSYSLQGHAGTMAECTACHASAPSTVSGGPHGMHPLGQQWVSDHGGAAEHGDAAQCQACHGVDYRGTVLSRSQANRTISSDFGTKVFWRGFQIGCYACHDGPDSEDPSPNRAPVVRHASLTTVISQPAAVNLRASDPDQNPLTLRIVSQPAHGTVGVQGRVATYYPDSGFAGPDKFTFAAWDGKIDSNLGTVAVTVQ